MSCVEDGRGSPVNAKGHEGRGQPGELQVQQKHTDGLKEGRGDSRGLVYHAKALDLHSKATGEPLGKF